VAEPAIQHPGQHQFGSGQDAPDVDVEDRVGDRVVLLGEPARGHDARVVDQNRRRRTGRVDRPEERREGIPGADIETAAQMDFGSA
jgi:hypothetical protein